MVPRNQTQVISVGGGHPYPLFLLISPMPTPPTHWSVVIIHGSLFSYVCKCFTLEFIFCVWEYCLYCVCASFVVLMSMKTRRGHWISWKWSYRWLWAMDGGSGTEHWSSRRTTSALMPPQMFLQPLNYKASSVLYWPNVQLWKVWNIQCALPLVACCKLVQSGYWFWHIE